MGDGASREAVVSNDALARAYDIGPRRPAYLIRKSAAAQPLIQDRLAESNAERSCASDSFSGGPISPEARLIAPTVPLSEATVSASDCFSVAGRAWREFAERDFGEREIPPIQQHRLSFPACCFQHEIGPASAERRRRTVNQRLLSLTGAQVDRFAPRRCPFVSVQALPPPVYTITIQDCAHVVNTPVSVQTRQSTEQDNKENNNPDDAYRWDFWETDRFRTSVTVGMTKMRLCDPQITPHSHHLGCVRGQTWVSHRASERFVWATSGRVRELLLSES